MTGCVGTLLGVASWPTEDNHSLQVNILLGSEKPNHGFPVTRISPLSKGPPNKRSPTLLLHVVFADAAESRTCAVTTERGAISLAHAQFFNP